jgi:hypothetical protein
VVAGVRGVVLFLVGASVWLALGLAFASVHLSAFALRRRAGVPQATLWRTSPAAAPVVSLNLDQTVSSKLGLRHTAIGG